MIVPFGTNIKFQNELFLVWPRSWQACITPTQILKSVNVSEAINSRFSVRSFLDVPVAKETVEDILRIASQAPSGANMQPWQVYVISGEPLAELSKAALESVNSGVEETPEYPVYPLPLPDPYNTRRFDTGMGLYKALGIERKDKSARHKQMLENFRFFGAPVGLIFTVDKIFVPGQLGDLGMFIQNVMLVAREFDLSTCPQGAWQLVNQTVHRLLDIPDEQLVFCGLALGQADLEHPVNKFQPERLPVESFTRFTGFTT